MKQLTRIEKIKSMIEEDLSVDVKEILEWMKCKRSFRYFCHKFVKIPEPGDDIKLNPNECQEIFIDTFFKYRYVVVNKSRQIGISTILQAICVYLLIFYKNVVIGIISRDQGEATEFVTKTKHIMDKLPDYFVPPYEKCRYQAIKFEIEDFGGTGSEIKSGWVNISKPEAVFRGAAITFLIIDEAAFISKVKKAFTAIKAGTSKAQKTAKRKMIPFGTVIVSTPNTTEGIGEWFYKEFLRAIRPDSVYKALLLHWSFIKEYVKDKQWYLDQCEQYDFEWEDIDQEFNCMFLPGSKECIFEIETIRALNMTTSKIVEQYSNFKSFVGNLQIYKRYNKDNLYIVSFDTATATGKSYSSVQVIEFDTMKQVAEYQGKLSMNYFPDVVKGICDLYPTCVIIGEYNTINQSICDHLADDHRWKRHLYKEIRYDKKTGKINKEFNGIYTDKISRPKITESLYLAVKDNPNIVRSSRLKFELCGLKEKKGRITATYTDDLAMAFAFAVHLKINRLYKDIPFYKNEFVQQINYDEKISINNIILDIEDETVNEMFLPKRIYRKHFGRRN